MLPVGVVPVCESAGAESSGRARGTPAADAVTTHPVLQAAGLHSAPPGCHRLGRTGSGPSGLRPGAVLHRPRRR